MTRQWFSWECFGRHQLVDPYPEQVEQQVEPEAADSGEKKQPTTNKKTKQNKKQKKTIKQQNNKQQIPLKKCRIVIEEYDGMDDYIKKTNIKPAKPKSGKKKLNQKKKSNMGRHKQVLWTDSE